MFTINHVAIEIKNSVGAALPNAIFMAFDNTTKTFIADGPAMTDETGYWAQHCVGIVNASGDCLPAISGAPAWCLFHGIGFPPGQDISCQINSTITVIAADLVSMNTSTANAVRGVPLVMMLGTLTTMSMIMTFNWNPEGGMDNMPVSQYDVRNYNTGELAFRLLSAGEGGSPPAFMQPYRFYTISFNSSGINYSYPFMTPTSGMTGAQIMIANSTYFPPGSGYVTVYGKVVNETNNAVPNAIVYAQFYKGPGGAFGIMFFNSSVTDSNGMFSMKVPKTKAPGEPGNTGNSGFYPMFQFYIVSNQTNPSTGAPLYFPTTDNNNNRGFFALGNTVLPPLVLKAGGEVRANVTLNNAGMVMSELSKFSTLGSGVKRDDVTGKFTMLKFFETVTLPSSIVIPIISPVGNAIVNLLGKNVSFGDPMSGNIVSACINTSASVTQGAVANIACNLTNPGYLNLTVFGCNNVLDINTSDYSKCPSVFSDQNRDKRVGGFNFWFETAGILRNDTGGVVSYINPEGILLENILGGFGSQEQPNLSIPLPPGNYSLELVPSFDYSWYAGTYNTTLFEIFAGQTTNQQLVRGKSFRVEPMFNPSFTLSGNNEINVSVSVEGQSTLLSDINITLNGTKLLYQNKTAAVAGIIFQYNNQTQQFYNTTFNASKYGLPAGKYILLLNASKTAGSTIYSSTFSMPVFMYDFQAGIDLGGFTFGTGQNVTGKIFAFNSTGPIATNTSGITIRVTDETDSEVSVASSIGSITNGMGTFNIIMPSTLGFYEITVVVPAGGKSGVADNWVQVTSLSLKTTTDRQNYRPSDNITLTVQVANASSGSAIANAGVEVVVDNSNTPAMGTTDSNGKAAITLTPSRHSSTGTGSWSFGWHNMKIKISKETATDVIKLESWAGFDVRGFDLQFRPDRPAYSTSENVTIQIFGLAPGEYSVSTVKVDGRTLSSCMYELGCFLIPGTNFHMNDQNAIQEKDIELGTWAVGHHNVEFKVSYGSGEQTFFTGFDVRSFNIMANTDNFVYALHSNLTLTVKASFANGTKVSGANVTATLFKAQPPNDIQVNQTYRLSDTNGEATLWLYASQPGFNYIRINISGQLQFIGIQVSSVNVSLFDSFGGSITDIYTGSPGDNLTIYVNARSGASPVANGSTVRANLWAFGNKQELSSNTTTSGNATITFQVPSTASQQNYGLEVSVVTTSGDQGFAQPAMLSVTGGTAMEFNVFTDRSFNNPYKAGDNASFTARLTYQNGTGVPDYNITFEMGAEGQRSEVLSTAVTDSSGLAKITTSITNQTDGPYYLHAYVVENSDLQAYTGFIISALKINVSTDKDTYAPGENITLTFSLINRSSGSQVNATSGFVAIFNKDKGEIQQSFSPSGLSQPYAINVSIPNESGAVGSYPLAVVVFVNQSMGVGFSMINVKNSSLGLNLTLPTTITAGTSFLANISASAGTTAELRIFSPAAESVVYENTSIALSGTPKTASVNVTINTQGVYVFNVFISGIGVQTTIVSVSQSSGAAQIVWTGTSTTQNATTFTTSQSVYIMTNTANATAKVLSADNSSTTTVSVPLSSTTGSTYYGALDSSNLVSGRTYFVRLDTSTSSGVTTTMFRVS
jgi:hypothetical protein